MDTNTVQLKVTLPSSLLDFLRGKSSKFGLTMSSYVKNLILNDVKGENYPEYTMSDKTEEIALKAMKEYVKNNTKEIEDVDDFLNNL